MRLFRVSTFRIAAGIMILVSLLIGEVGAITPTIDFTDVPLYGSSNDLVGKVTNVTPDDYKVAVYIYVSGWWTKPSFAYPLTSISGSGSWVCDITTGGSDQYATKIRAYLVPDGYTPPQMSGGQIFPAELDLYPNVETTRRTERRITFSGYDWFVKSSVIPVGPGLNYFSDSAQSVWVDEQGQLHLKIINSGSTWYSAEVISSNSFGYGRYSFEIASRIDQLDKNVVAGFFTWDDAAPPYYREIDFAEFSRWGEALNVNSQYVVQPWDIFGNRYRFNINLTGNNSTHSADWKENIITFQSVEGSNVIGSWIYTGNYIPSNGKENVRINLWLYDPLNILGKPPTDGVEAEIIVKNFEFISPSSTPASTDTPTPTPTPPLTSSIIPESYQNVKIHSTNQFIIAVATDKQVYELGEPVKIYAYFRNMGIESIKAPIITIWDHSQPYWPEVYSYPRNLSVPGETIYQNQTITFNTTWTMSQPAYPNLSRVDQIVDGWEVHSGKFGVQFNAWNDNGTAVILNEEYIISGISMYLIGSEPLPITPTPTATPTPTPTPIVGVNGDVSGDGQVSVVDALFIAQYTVGTRTLTSTQLEAADVNGDGQVTIVDALFIAQYTVGLRQL